MSKNRIFGLLLALVLLVGAFTIAVPNTAQALPSNEVTTTYYSDATLTNVVGEHILLCTGGYYDWGQRTAYKTVDSISCRDLGY
jgi:uncharacterized protein DUF6289